MSFQDPLMQRLVGYIASPKFQCTFENFFLEEAFNFDDDDEQKLIYTEIYGRFQKLFDETLEEFLQAENLTAQEFTQRCSETLEDDSTKDAQYVKIILASMDYTAFVALMKVMRPRSEQRRMAEAKPSTGENLKRKGSQDDSDEEADAKGCKAEGKESEGDKKEEN